MTTVLPFYPWLEDLLARLRERFAREARDGAHDLAHALRVARQAHRLAEVEGADAEACVAAALLHDLVYLPKNHPDSRHTAAMAAEEARGWCALHPALEVRAEVICGAILTHSFSGGRVPTTLEGAVLQDADRLEALGAIGIARCFATGGSMGIGLWHPEDPWGRQRERNDKAWSLDHFFQKLLTLEGTMRTPSGRAEAAARTATLRGFLEALAEELGEGPEDPIASR